MGRKTLITSMIAGALFTCAAIAETKAIVAVARALPAPQASVIPASPVVPHLSAQTVSFFEPDRTHVTASQPHHIDISAFGIPCGESVHLKKMNRGTYRVRVADSCRPYELVTFRFGGLSFDMRLPMTGERAFELPIWPDFANLETVFSDSPSISNHLDSASAHDRIRLAISWEGEAKPLLKADGLDVITLGDGPRQLQMISVPEVSEHQKIVRLTLARTVTAETCGKPTIGTVFRQVGDGVPLRYQLSLAPLDCSRVGETLELKNILEDLKLAAN